MKATTIRTLQPQLAERGVYFANATKGGRLQVFAVDSHGEEIERIRLDDFAWTSGESAVEWLWRELDRVDPPVCERATLELVR